MAPEDPPFVSNEEDRVVQRGITRLAVPLVDSHDNVDGAVARDLAQSIDSRPRDGNGASVEKAVELTEGVGAPRRDEPYPEGVARNERLGEGDQVSPAFRGLLGQGAGLIECGFEVEENGSRLHRGDAKGL